jgi:hypothetical protein
MNWTGFFSSLHLEDPFWGPPTLLFNAYQGLVPQG